MRRALAVAGAIVLLVAIAIALAWWSTTPPSELAKDAPGPATLAVAPVGSLSVGAAAVEITPEPAAGLYLAGFDLGRRATAVHDPLFARALAIQRGEVRVVFVVLDVIGLSAHHAERVGALARSVDPRSLLVLATHVHSAPDTLGLWGPHPLASGVDPRFLERVLEGAAKAADQAVASLRPARLRLASGAAPERGVSKNKRDPDLIDREVLVVAADALDGGAPIATAVVFACHPEVLMGANTDITADFPGALVRAVEARRGGTALYLNGPLGGMVTPDVAAHTFAESERVGTTLARVALDALASPDARAVERVPLAWARRPILVPVQNRRFILARKLGVFDRPFEGRGYVRSEVAALRLGPLALATIPGEPLPRVGLDVKVALKAPFRAVLGLAGDELGYIIPEDAFQDPARYRYEKTVSPGPLATTLIRGTVIQAAVEASAAVGE